MSTKAKLNKLLKTKEDIKKAIQNKGGNVGDVFDEYPAAISKLKSGRVSVKDLGLKFGYSTANLDDIVNNFDFTGVEDFEYMFYTSEPQYHNGGYNYVKGGSITLPDGDKNLKYAFQYRSLDKLVLGKGNLIEWYDSFCAKEIDFTGATTTDNSLPNYAFTVKDYPTSYLANSLTKNLTVRPFDKVDSRFESSVLTRESLLDILNKAKVVEGEQHFLYLSQSSVNQLTDEEISIAVDKGWTISPAKTEVVVITDDNYNSIRNVSAITPSTYDLSGNTSKTIDLYYTNVIIGDVGGRLSCSSNLKYIDVNFLSSVTNLSAAIGSNGGARTLYHLNVTGDFSNVTDMYYLFGNTYTYFDTELDVSGWDVSNCTNFTGMFSASNIKPIGYENWNVSKDANIEYLFNYSLLESIDLSNWKDLTYVKSFALNCPNLVELKCPSGKTNYNEVIFQNNPKLKKLDASMITQDCRSGGIISVGNGTFSNCRSLEELKLPTYYKRSASNTHSFACAFYNCESLKEIDFTGAPVGDISYAFVNCKSLKKIIMPTAPSSVNERTFEGINPYGTFYYDPQYDYSNVFNYLPSTWKRVPITQ